MRSSTLFFVILVALLLSYTQQHQQPVNTTCIRFFPKSILRMIRDLTYYPDSPARFSQYTVMSTNDTQTDTFFVTTRPSLLECMRIHLL